MVKLKVELIFESCKDFNHDGISFLRVKGGGMGGIKRRRKLVATVVRDRWLEIKSDGDKGMLGNGKFMVNGRFDKEGNSKSVGDNSVELGGVVRFAPGVRVGLSRTTKGGEVELFLK